MYEIVEESSTYTLRMEEVIPTFSDIRRLTMTEQEEDEEDEPEQRDSICVSGALERYPGSWRYQVTCCPHCIHCRIAGFNGRVVQYRTNFI